jgi:probable HAF family extracellular repeat protein
VDTIPPSPPTTVSAVAASSNEITLTWSGASDAVGVTKYKVYRGSSEVASTASATHAEVGLTAGTQYCYEVTASDAAGNESARSAQACATTNVPADTTPPKLTSTVPVNDGKNVAVDNLVTVVFDEAINPATLTKATFTVKDASNNAVDGTISYSGTTGTFTSSEIFAPLETYTATIAADVQDLAGNNLTSNYVWKFKTGLATYQLTAIGTDMPGDDEQIFTRLVDLNEQGDVAGEATRSWNLDGDTGEETIAFIWRDGELIDLSTPLSSVESRSQGINDRGDVIGWSSPSIEESPAFLWRDERVSALGLQDAYAINNEGQVAGYVTRVENDEAVSTAVIWQAGKLTELRGLANPWNINNAGDVVGFSYVQLQLEASLWRSGVVTPLGKLPGAAESQAFDINTRRVVVGTNYFAPPISTDFYERAFLWESGKMIELPLVAANHSSSGAYGINDRGHAVGRSGSSRSIAAVWMDGSAYDLNELIASDDPLKPYVTLLEGQEINNRGQIIVQGTDSRRSGSYSGYLLTPKRSR